MSSDARSVHVKLVNVNGRQHFCTVCPPSEEVHDDMVWRFPRQDSAHAASPQIFTYSGLDNIVEYITTKQDQFSEIHGMLC